jgi:Domain of unknown function (DUF3885)
MSEQTFDLIGYMDKHFRGFGFGGNVLASWTLGLRFNIGLAYVDRAVQIYEQAFQNTGDIVLIGEDEAWDADPKRWYSLFSLPGLFRSNPPTLSSREFGEPEDEDAYAVTWAFLPRRDLDPRLLFQAIANQDHGLAPSVRGRIYLLDPSAELLLHMYDDRGLDIISTRREDLIPLHERFGDWLNAARLNEDEPWRR